MNEILNDFEFSTADFIGGLINEIVKTSLDDVIDVESEFVSDKGEKIDDIPGRGIPAVKWTASMPVKAIFNLKYEDSVPVLDDNGEPVYEAKPGENGQRRIVKKTVKMKNPVLASKVFFEDGSWTVVKNASCDPVELVETKLSNGGTAITASDASKERALAYAIVKHAFGKLNPDTKEVYGSNLGRIFDKVIAASVDQNVVEAERKAKKSRNKTDKPAFRKPLPRKPKSFDTPKTKLDPEDRKKLDEVLSQAKSAVGELLKGLMNPNDSGRKISLNDIVDRKSVV